MSDKEKIIIESGTFKQPFSYAVMRGSKFQLLDNPLNLHIFGG